MKPKTNTAQAAIESVAEKPVSLDDCRVSNWRDGTMAMLNPDASRHTQFAWLHGQIGEINDLLYGYISMPTSAAEHAQEMADALCRHIEMKTTVLVRVLGHLCEQTLETERDMEAEG